ncbi:MAG: Transcriptional regulator PA2737, MerR family, partial [uncultured Sphingomonadaceae bacterium]
DQERRSFPDHRRGRARAGRRAAHPALLGDALPAAEAAAARGQPPLLSPGGRGAGAADQPLAQRGRLHGTRRSAAAGGGRGAARARDCRAPGGAAGRAARDPGGAGRRAGAGQDGAGV